MYFLQKIFDLIKKKLKRNAKTKHLKLLAILYIYQYITNKTQMHTNINSIFFVHFHVINRTKKFI